MNILFICDEYPPGKVGGIGVAVKNLAENLVKVGNEVVVVGLYPYYYGQRDEEVVNGVKIIRRRYGIKTASENWIIKGIRRSPSFVKKIVNGKNTFSEFVLFVEKVIDQSKINIIEIADWNSFSLQLGYKIIWPKFQVPMVLKAHGSYTKIMEDHGLKGNIQFLDTDKDLFFRADAHIAVSKHVADFWQNKYGTGKEIDIIYNGIKIENELYLNSNIRNQFIYAGSITKEKGVGQLLMAWNLVYDKINNAKLILCGKGDFDKFEKMILPKAINSVVFKGFMSQEELAIEFRNSVGAVLPSLSETFGLTAVEAMSVGCPVIYTIRSSGSEIITPGEDGFLVDPLNIVEIAETIVTLYNSILIQKQFSTAGHAKVLANFNIDKIAQQHLDFYRKTILNFSEK